MITNHAVDGIKKCVRCKEEYMFEEFYEVSDRADGHAGTCKWCYLSLQRTRRTLRAQQRKEDYAAGLIKPMAERWCKLCDDVKAASEFYRRWDTDSLLSHYCKECHIADNTRRVQIMRAKHSGSHMDA
jgi:hypothetical protein